jgi:hypothetical protein
MKYLYATVMSVNIIMNLYNIDGVTIPFDKTWRSISISLSGGADSALLAYLLCSFVPENQSLIVHVISHTRMWKTRPWQGWDSLYVYNWLVNRFPHIKFKRHTNFIAPELEYGSMGPALTDEYGKQVSGDNIEIRAFAEYVCFWENVDAYYNAVTRNPRNVDFVGIPGRDVDPTDNNKHLELMIHMDKYAVHPFRFVEKDWVVRQYKRLDIESLFNISRSCEGEFENLTYKNYIPGQYVPTCGKCFWCQEREWAIGRSFNSLPPS